MIYRGFNQNELKKITEILERHQVHFEVGVPDSSMDYINDPKKRVDHRFMDNLLQIQIEKEEFDKIPEKDLQKLFDLRIYREEESPFTEEELLNTSHEEELKTPAPKRPDPHAKLNQAAAILAITTVTLFYLWKSGFFK